MKWSRALVGIVAASSLALAACGGGTDTPADNGGELDITLTVLKATR